MVMVSNLPGSDIGPLGKPGGAGRIIPDHSRRWYMCIYMYIYNIDIHILNENTFESSQVFHIDHVGNHLASWTSLVAEAWGSASQLMGGSKHIYSPIITRYIPISPYLAGGSHIIPYAGGYSTYDWDAHDVRHFSARRCKVCFVSSASSPAPQRLIMVIHYK